MLLTRLLQEAEEGVRVGIRVRLGERERRRRPPQEEGGGGGQEAAEGRRAQEGRRLGQRGGGAGESGQKVTIGHRRSP